MQQRLWQKGLVRRLSVAYGDAHVARASLRCELESHPVLDGRRLGVGGAVSEGEALLGDAEAWGEGW